MRWAWREKLLGLLDRSARAAATRNNGRLARFLGLVDQHLRLILQRDDLVVDLLQLTLRP
jgi:hypothetical protein